MGGSSGAGGCSAVSVGSGGGVSDSEGTTIPTVGSGGAAGAEACGIEVSVAGFTSGEVLTGGSVLVGAAAVDAGFSGVASTVDAGGVVVVSLTDGAVGGISGATETVSSAKAIGATVRLKAHSANIVAVTSLGLCPSLRQNLRKTDRSMIKCLQS